MVTECHVRPIAMQHYMRLCSSVGTKIPCVDRHSRHFNGNSKISSPWTKVIIKKHKLTDKWLMANVFCIVLANIFNNNNHNHLRSNNHCISRHRFVSFLVLFDLKFLFNSTQKCFSFLDSSIILQVRPKSSKHFIKIKVQIN